MRKIQKLFSGILCCSMLFLLTSTAFATATPYYLVRTCSKCLDGAVYRTETEEFDEEIHRQHGSHYDIIYEYEVTVHEYCDSCDYTNDYSYEREDIIYCADRK